MLQLEGPSRSESKELHEGAWKKRQGLMSTSNTGEVLGSVFKVRILHHAVSGLGNFRVGIPL